MKRLLVLCVGLSLAGPVLAEAWGVFKSDRLGFSMLVAPGTKWEARDFGDGWGGIHTKTGVFEFFAIRGAAASATELGQAAIRLTGVPGPAWRKVDEGRNKAGWSWWQTFEVRNNANGRMLFTVIGTGRRGSYVLFVGTTQADFAAHNELYQQWYRSLTLY